MITVVIKVFELGITLQGRPPPLSTIKSRNVHVYVVAFFLYSYCN